MAGGKEERRGKRKEAGDRVSKERIWEDGKGNRKEVRTEEKWEVERGVRVEVEEKSHWERSKGREQGE